MGDAGLVEVRASLTSETQRRRTSRSRPSRRGLEHESTSARQGAIQIANLHVGRPASTNRAKCHVIAVNQAAVKLRASRPVYWLPAYASPQHVISQPRKGLGLQDASPLLSRITQAAFFAYLRSTSLVIGQISVSFSRRAMKSPRVFRSFDTKRGYSLYQCHASISAA